jgi:hypothetical protein
MKLAKGDWKIMGKFIVHGILIEEPSRSTLASGLDCTTLKIEEKYSTSFKEVVSVYSVDFIGKSANCIPTNVRLAGAPVVVMGTLSSREYKGRFYNDLRGEQLSIITTNAFVKDSAPTQAHIEETISPDFEQTDLADDDLPF